ncbi:MAG TPA: YCF48-related protein, partial [Bacteroidota bacterium]|nr:YCF48-related protein [Bacteroidota bacterium]
MRSRLLLLACLCAMLSPASHAQSHYWVQTNGPGSGYDVRSFAATSQGTLYAGTWTDGTIWKTTNLGGSWTQCGPIPNPNPVLSICALPNDHLLACVYLKGIFRSTDGGASWQERDSLLTDATLRMSVVDDSGYVWVATVSGLFCSTNEGATWSLREAGGFYQVLLDSSHAILTTDGTYLYRSTTHGRTWTKTILAPCGDLRGVHPDGSYFGVTASSGIYRSTDLGATWTDMHSGVTWSGYTDAMTFSAGGRIFYGRDGSAGGMLYSADTGKTWTILNSGLTTNRVLPLFRHPSGYIFVGTNGAGVFRSAARADTTYRVAINVSP